MATYDDLTGIWTNTYDKGTYYFRQINEKNNIYFAWFGEGKALNDPTKTWTNVAMGTREGDTIKINWCDVPKGNLESKGDMAKTINVKITQNPLQLKADGGGWFGSGFFQPK